MTRLPRRRCRAPQGCNVDQHRLVQAQPWIQLGGFDQDPPCAPAPAQGPLGSGYRRAEDPGVPDPYGWEVAAARAVITLLSGGSDRQDEKVPASP